MSSFLLVCSQSYTIANNVATCSGSLNQYDVTGLAPFFDLSQLDQATASQYFVAGFTVVGIFACAGILFRMFIKSVLHA